MTDPRQTADWLGRCLSLPYAEAVARTKAALAEQGFGTLSEIDLRQTLTEKRGSDFRPYVILGACNPALAEQALTAELSVGLLLPCNVIVYESDAGTMVEALDPEVALRLLNKPALAPIAHEARLRLERALAALGSCMASSRNRARAQGAQPWSS